MSKHASLDAMIVTTLFFYIIFISGESQFWYSWAHFGACFLFFDNRLLFSHEFLYTCFWYYCDYQYAKNNFSCCFLLCWVPFWHILGQFWCGIFNFLKTVQYFFHGILYKFLKTLWPLWILFNCLKATKPLQGYSYFLRLSSQKVLVLVLLRWP